MVFNTTTGGVRMEQDYKKFIDLLQTIPIRCTYKRDEPYSLTEEELQEFYLLSDTEGDEDACNILRPLYKKYRSGTDRGKRTMPELIVRGIYFIIFREMTVIYNNDLVSEPRDRKLLEQDNKLHRRVFPKCSNRVFQLLGDKNCKLQSRMGIQPLKDFTMIYYEPVKFHSTSGRDMLFRELIVSILYQSNYSMFIDLSGEDTILQDFYYCDEEVIYCNDSVTANFYYILQTRYKDFCKIVKMRVKGLQGDLNQILYEYRQTIEDRKLFRIEEFYSKCSTEFKAKAEKKIDSFKKPLILTYPLFEEYADEDLAYRWMMVLLGRRYHWSLEDLKRNINQILDTNIRWLQMRISKAMIAWGNGVKEFLSDIQDGNVGFLSLPYEGELKRIPPTIEVKKKFSFYENTAKRKERMQVALKKRHYAESIEDFKGNYENIYVDSRIRKGFLFYDYKIARREGEVLAFQRFAEDNECFWAFVCKEEDSFWIEKLSSDKQRSCNIIGVDKTSKYGAILWSIGFCLDTVIVTNVEVKIVFYEWFMRLQKGVSMDDPLEWEKTIRVDNWSSWKSRNSRSEYEE